MKKLYVDSVTKSFGHQQVLTDIFISCTPGEIVGLLGRNGSGKSTLLKIIFGAMQTHHKFVTIDGSRTNGLFKNRNKLNYLPQHHFLPEHVTIKKLILLFCDKKQAKQLMEHECIKPLLDKKSRQLSGGEKRLVEIFLILFSRTRYKLMDEPFNGVAPVYREEIKKLLRAEAKEKAFIITDHDYNNILQTADRIFLLTDGGTKEVDNKQELAFYGYLPEKNPINTY